MWNFWPPTAPNNLKRFNDGKDALRGTDGTDQSGLWEKQYRKQPCDSYCRIKIVVVLLVRLSYETICSCFCDAICYLLGPVFQEVPECTRFVPRGTEIPQDQQPLKTGRGRISRQTGPSPEFAPKKTTVKLWIMFVWVVVSNISGEMFPFDEYFS